MMVVLRNPGILTAIGLGVFGATVLACSPAQALVNQVATPPTAQAFARRQAISSVSISPDGSRVVGIIASDGSQRVLAIWDTANLEAAPYLIGVDDRSELVGVQFAKDDRLFVSTQQMVNFSLGGEAQRSFRRRTQIVDLQGQPVRVNLTFDGLTAEQQAYVGVGSVVSILPRDPQSILTSDPMRGDIYKLNLYDGRAERVQRGSSRFSTGVADHHGEVRSRSEINFDNGAVYSALWLRDAQGQWAEHFRSYARDRKSVSVAGFSSDPNIIFISMVPDNGEHEAIFEYNIADRKVGEEAFAHPIFDAQGVITSSSDEDFGEAIGFSYSGERSRTVWVDERIAQIEALARRALNIEEGSIIWQRANGAPARLGVFTGADVSLVSISRDRSKAILRKSGPDAPPEYYIYQNGRFALLGRAYPELSEQNLAEMELVQYRARDGLYIPAFLVKPDPETFGAGPYPAIVVPHGGPWARDDAEWDPSAWTQYFATRGYAVIQPQFRGSLGWGQTLWRAGDRQWGLAMQDDLDDAVQYMIAEGVTVAGRVAIHGYSYGGYAAMIAATREQPVFACAIAGAGPATIDLFKKGTYQNRYLREFQHPTAEGIDPLRYVNSVSIPVYLYTGDRDTVVVPAESRTFAAALQRAGKKVKLEILPNMEHSLGTWTPDNIAQILTTVEEFLKNDCGLPGAAKIG
ncbi:alpha/beta hydrolase family protein [Brevundimonas sp.]|uniref:alpha/beta hydrolase family protein n=1 Tax=Brevundimonas sp. TaxID=1871086 RepID=UPI00289FEEB5|nr:prolyl oligopeptidase family serine peptidase [Brevundimonas sp.]